MQHRILGRIGSMGMACAGLMAGWALSAAEETAPGLITPLPVPIYCPPAQAVATSTTPEATAEATAEAKTKAQPDPKALVTPVEIKDVYYECGLSLDGAWLLYTVAPAKVQPLPKICARNLKTNELKELGSVAWQGRADQNKGPQQLVMVPRAASADLSRIWLSAGTARLWHWEPATEKLTACSTTDDKNSWLETTMPVTGGSADGKHLALVEVRQKALVFDAATGKIVERVERPDINTYLDELHWAGNRLILTSPYSLGSGDLIQLWPKTSEARWKPLLKDGDLKVMWVGAQGENAVVRTDKRLCRWSPEKPATLEELAVLAADQEVLMDPSSGRLVLSRLLLPAADKADKADTVGKVKESTLEITVLDRDGKPVFEKPQTFSLAKALAPLETIADASTQRYLSAQLRAQPVVARGDRMFIRLQRENRRGASGEVFETVALVEFGANPGVTTDPKQVFQWASGGIVDRSMPAFQALPTQGICLAVEDQLLRIYRLP